MNTIKKFWNIETPYISKEGGENLKKFIYKGGDKSLSYNYFWSPLCNWIVNYLPLWLAYISSLCHHTHTII